MMGLKNSVIFHPLYLILRIIEGHFYAPYMLLRT